MNLNSLPSKKTIVLHLFLWAGVWVVLYINLLGAWSNDVMTLTSFAIIACAPAVYLSRYFYEKLILEDIEIKLSKNLIFLAVAFIMSALSGSIASYYLGSCWAGDWEKDPLYETTYQGVHKGVETGWIGNVAFNKDSVKLCLISKEIFCQFYEMGKNGTENGTEKVAKATKNTAWCISYIRNFPEALWAIFIFIAWEVIIGMIKKRKELEAKNAEIEQQKDDLDAKNREIKEKNDALKSKNAEIKAQNKEIQLSMVSRELLAQNDVIHDLMNTYFAGTESLKGFAKQANLADSEQKKLNRIIQVHESVGELQRFRYASILNSASLVPLSDEIEGLKLMIQVIKYLRPNIKFNEDIETDTETDTDRYFVVPSLFGELLWNAQKHSKNTDQSKTVEITISLAIQANQSIYFYIENPIGNKPTQNTTKTGLDLIEQRLNLQYEQGDFSFETSIEDPHSDNFSAKLIVPLKP
jgi:two-component sensor histidine kinase